MAKYGNSGGRNRGKKYKKLKGFEQATPESEAKARAFMDWYGANYGVIRNKIAAFSEDTANDTAIYLYDCIALKGFEIKDNLGYFLRAYHTARLPKKKAPEIAIDEAPHLTAPDFNYEKYEATVEVINTEILDYVRARYKPYSASLFEIYIGLQPEINYKGLAEMLNIPYHTIRWYIREIVKDVEPRFKKRKDFLLSTV